jgi:hypothetical protein
MKTKTVCWLLAAGFYCTAVWAQAPAGDWQTPAEKADYRSTPDTAIPWPTCAVWLPQLRAR